MNIDWAFEKVYDDANYNCAHFVIEIWKRCLGFEVNALASFLTGRSSRVIDSSARKAFTRLTEPRQWCLVLFHTSRTAPHVGIWLNGRVIHNSKSGVHWVDLEAAMLGFNKVSYYEIK